MKNSSKRHRHKHCCKKDKEDERCHKRRRVRSRSRSKDRSLDPQNGRSRTEESRIEDMQDKVERFNDEECRSEERRNGPKSKWENDENDSFGRNGRRVNESKFQWGKKGETENKAKKPQENKAKPDFGLSGKLAEEVNTYKGVVIKYSEPAEARKPKRRWRLYPFKGDTVLPTMYIHRQSAYLIGRDRVVADLPVDHPSCSKQHAVLQYRVVGYNRSDGTKGNRVRPYIIDLDSANGTYVNNVRIESRRYVELMEKDVIKFAYSSREYVLLHEHSRDDDEDDNVNFDEVAVKKEN